MNEEEIFLKGRHAYDNVKVEPGEILICKTEEFGDRLTIAACKRNSATGASRTIHWLIGGKDVRAVSNNDIIV